MKPADIQSCLIQNGYLMRQQHLKGRSISDIDKSIIRRIRAQAKEQGVSQKMIDVLEMDGILGRESIAGRTVWAEFIGLQDICRWGIKVRFYNIVGSHPSANSTVTVLTLIHNGIYPQDISFPRILFELGKEIFLLLCDQFDSVKEKAGHRLAKVFK